MKSEYSLKNPYTAKFQASRPLCKGTGGKETFHIEIGVSANELPFEAGDSLCVMPENHSELVSAIIAKLNHPADTEVSNHKGEKTTLQNHWSASARRQAR